MCPTSCQFPLLNFSKITFREDLSKSLSSFQGHWQNDPKELYTWVFLKFLAICQNRMIICARDVLRVTQLTGTS